MMSLIVIMVVIENYTIMMIFLGMNLIINKLLIVWYDLEKGIRGATFSVNKGWKITLKNEQSLLISIPLRCLKRLCDKDLK